ncbi:MAG: hypothetical protein Q7S18_02340 [bacterium]|nr:hypothetical protein [bacterium]
MVLATHALVGAVIGKNIQNPWIIIAISLSVHYILDSFRHGEYLELFDSAEALKKSYWKVTLDLAIAAAIIFSLIYFEKLDLTTIRNTLIGVFASLFPDLLTLLYWLFRWKFLEKIYKFHSWIHRFPRTSPNRLWNFRNARNDIILSLIAILILIIF